MRKLRITCAGLLFAVLLAFAVSLPAEACCIASTPAELFEGADVVFFGRVVQQTHPLGKGGTESEFEVLRVLKGTPGPRVKLWETTGPAPGGLPGQWIATSVDVDYRLGESYIVFAAQGENGWSSSICSGTRPLSALTEEALVEAGLEDLVSHLPGVEPGAEPGVELGVEPGVQPGPEPGAQPGAAGAEGTVRPAGLWWAAVLAGPVLVAAGVTARRRMRRH